MKVMDLNGGHLPPNLGEQAYGIEVELENVRLGTARVNRLTDAGGWFITADGSLRNNGVEFLTPPVGLDRAKEMTNALWHEWGNSLWTGGQRCGIHVHMDMGERTLEQLRAVLVAYSCIEPALFRLCGAEREQNIYCVPWYRAGGDLPIIYRALEQAAEDPVRARQRLDHTCKYSALYAEPLLRFGTIEFRGAPVFETVQGMHQLLDTLSVMMAAADECEDADAVLSMFEDNPTMALHRFAPAFVDCVALLDEVDSLGTAANLVRTNQVPEWEPQEARPDEGPGPLYRHVHPGPALPARRLRPRRMQELDQIARVDRQVAVERDLFRDFIRENPLNNRRGR